MNGRVAVTAWLGVSFLLMIVGSIGPWGNLILGHSVGGWDTSGGPTVLVAIVLLALCALPAALLPKSPKPARVSVLAIGVFLGLVMAALAVYWAGSIEKLVSSTSGVEGAGWGVWVTAVGAVSAELALIALLVVAIVSPGREPRAAVAPGVGVGAVAGGGAGAAPGAYAAPAPTAVAAAPAASPAQHPAGWYPDPSTPGKQRYWDGTQWTQHTN